MESLQHWIEITAEFYVNHVTQVAHVKSAQVISRLMPHAPVEDHCRRFNVAGFVRPFLVECLEKVGDQVTWEMPFFAIGYTAFTNSAPTITGTSVTYGTRWGNHDIEFQVDTGSGYGGTWLNMIAANLIAQTFNSTTGFKLKIRATCAIASATNVIANMRVALTTTQSDRDTKLYPLASVVLTLTGLPTGCDITILGAGTESVRENTEDFGGTSYPYVYADPGTAVDIVVIRPGYMPAAVRNYALAESASSLPFSLTPDPSYLE